jgi:flavin reductase (DIM6/NTAB) family NADH-FMN oxidoreductase RutF
MLRSVMTCFPTGVTVVATRDPNGGPIGLTVNSFTSVSLDPPLVLVCIDRASQTHDPLLAAGTFAVSILAAGQTDLARRFAARPSAGRFEGVAWVSAPSGSPVLSGSAAWIDCDLHEAIAAGDHTIVLGFARAGAASDAPALLFYRGQMRSSG